MNARVSLPAGARRVGLVSACALALTALVGQATMAKDVPGNNGTVKIHDGAGEPAAEVRNEPHVCTFHLHFFFADDGQAGTWEIQEWAPGDKGQVVLEGTYDTMDDGEDRQPEQGVYELPDGHYKLFWDGDLDTNKHDKMKVFWVECESPNPVTQPTPTPSPVTQQTPLPTGEATPTPTNEASPTPTGEATPTPTGSDLAAGGGSTPTPTGRDLAGGVAGADVTPPPTDAATVEEAQSQVAWPIILLAIATIIVTASFLTPVRRNR
jgi:hypothetical protein